jgi:hypothetical protein
MKCSIYGCHKYRVIGRNEKGEYHRVCSEHMNERAMNSNVNQNPRNHIPRCVLCTEPRVRGWNKFASGYITHCKYHLNFEPLPKCNNPSCSNKRMWSVEHKFKYCAGNHCVSYECSQTGCHRITGPDIGFCSIHRSKTSFHSFSRVS